MKQPPTSHILPPHDPTCPCRLLEGTHTANVHLQYTHSYMPLHVAYLRLSMQAAGEDPANAHFSIHMQSHVQLRFKLA